MKTTNYGDSDCGWCYGTGQIMAQGIYTPCPGCVIPEENRIADEWEAKHYGEMYGNAQVITTLAQKVFDAVAGRYTEEQKQEAKEIIDIVKRAVDYPAVSEEMTEAVLVGLLLGAAKAMEQHALEAVNSLSDK